MRSPKYGDEIMIPDGYGSLVNGIVNSGLRRYGQPEPSEETMLVGVLPGAHKSGSQVISVRRSAHGTEWFWPEECPGAKEA